SGRVQDEVRVLTPVAEEVFVEAFLRGRFQEARGDDLVGVDVVDRQRDQFGFECGKGFHRMVLTSVTLPVMAEAAAVSGEARKVRPPWPWRPSKLRFEVETLYSPGWSWSPFIAMHMEQPGSR